MSPGERLAVHILTESRSFDLEGEEPTAATMSALISCALVTMNRCTDERVRARIAVTAIQGILENVEADRSLLREAVTEMALFDVAGSA